MIKICITFDDLPFHGVLPENYSHNLVIHMIIRALSRYNLKGIYAFSNALHILQSKTAQQSLERWLAHGHKLGNHTFSHFDLNKTDTGTYIEDIDKNHAFFLNYQADLSYFRYPYLHEGDHDLKRKMVRSHLFNMGAIPTPVTINTYDYRWNSILSLAINQKNINLINKIRFMFLSHIKEQVHDAQQKAFKLNQFDFSHILLMHCGITSAFYLPDVLQYLDNIAAFISLEETCLHAAYSMNTFSISKNYVNYLEQLAAMKAFNLEQ